LSIAREEKVVPRSIPTILLMVFSCVYKHARRGILPGAQAG
jgi:hypothetical protein